MPDRPTEDLREQDPSDAAEQASDAFRSEVYDTALKQPLTGGKGSDRLPGDSDPAGGDALPIKQADKPAPARAPEVVRDSSGRPVEVKTPHGDTWELAYDSDGKIARAKITHPSGKPEILERTEQGWWKVNGWVDYDLKNVEVLSEGTIRKTDERDGVLVSYPDGRVEGTDNYGRTSVKIDEDGTKSVYKYEDRTTGFGTKAVGKSGSPFAEILSSWGGAFNDGYEFTHKNGHKESLERREGQWEFINGTRRETLPGSTRVEVKSDGHRTFTRPDGSSFEGMPDGTTIDRNSKGKVTEITSPEGITTTFQLGDKEQVTGMDVRDSSGRLLESDRLTAEGWQTSLTDAAGKPLAVKKVEMDDKTGTCTLQLDGGRLVRLRDGTENQKGISGAAVEDYDDKVVSWMKHAHLDLSPAEEATLRADLAVINKLPAGKKEWILFSMDRIIAGNADEKTDLSQSQRADLAKSLAHQIAHPESISQGGKRAAVMASAERQMAVSRPDEYARMVSSLAIEGKYTAGDGNLVRVQRTRDGFLYGNTDSYHQRTLTSELFQNAAANIALAHDGKMYKSYAAGDGELERVPPGVDPSLDLGERVTDREGRVSGFEGLNAEQRKSLLGSLRLEVQDAGSVSSERELLAAWNERADKNAPMTIAITVPKERYHFWEQWHTSPEVNPDYHILTITYIDSSRNPAAIYFDNTAGGANHSYPGGQGVLSWDITQIGKK